MKNKKKIKKQKNKKQNMDPRQTCTLCWHQHQLQAHSLKKKLRNNQQTKKTKIINNIWIQDR